MPIERQCEQWPHRREAMLRAAAYLPHPPYPSSRPINFGDDDYYKNRGGAPEPVSYFTHDSYNFPPTGFNPPPRSKARPNIDWEQDEPEQPILPMDFPTHTTIPGMDYNMNPTEARLPYDRKPVNLYRGLVLNLRHPGASQIRRTLFGDTLEDELGDKDAPNRIPGMPTDEDLADWWNAHDYTNPALGSLILDHLQDRYHQFDLGRHWTLNPNTAIEFGGTANPDNHELPVVVKAQWNGAGEDPYRRDTAGDWDYEDEITLLPGAPLSVHGVHIQHPDSDEWHNVLADPQHRTAALFDAEPWGYPVRPDGSYDTDYLKRLPIHKNEYGERRQFSPTTVNPRSRSQARPDIEWEHTDPPQPTLDLDVPKGIFYRDRNELSKSYDIPVDRKPQRMYRSVLVDLAHPDLAEVRRRLYGDQHELSFGDTDANYTPHSYLPYMPEDYELAQAPWKPEHDPQTAQILLDHISRGNGDSASKAPFPHNTSLGRHWSTNFDAAHQFASPAMQDGEFHLPMAVTLGADWYGHGEDPYRRQTGGTFPEEHEITMLPGAPMHIREMHIQHPHTDQMIQLNLNPQQRHAGWLFTDDDRNSDDFFDVSSRRGTCTMCKRPRVLPPGPFCSHGENDEEFHRRLQLNPSVLYRTAYRDEEEEDEIWGEQGRPEPEHLYTPRWNDKNRPVLPSKQLDWEAFPPGTEHYHFSPHEVNPTTTSQARPDMHWDPIDDGDQHALDLGLDDEHTIIGGDIAPKLHKPVTLYRGLGVPLHHLGLQDVWRMLRGPEHKQLPDWMLNDHPRLPGMAGSDWDDRALAKTHPLGYDNPEVGHRILDYLEADNNPHGRELGLGRHWTPDIEQAKLFSGGAHGTKWLNDQLSLPAVISAEWHGAGEDPYRTKSWGHHDDEKEVTMLPGAKMRVKDVHIIHPQTGEWHSVYDGEPQYREASL